MKPENIETFRHLEKQVEDAEIALEGFIEEQYEAGPPVEVENLPPADRIDRVAGLLKQMITHPHEQRSMFGAKTLYEGNTLQRKVQTPSGEEYFVRFTVRTCKSGFRQNEFVSIWAVWTQDIEEDPYYYDYDEYVDNNWVHNDPDQPERLRELAELEWSFDAYLNGTCIEGIPEEN